MPSMTNTSITQYRITASIGVGGMGEVFRARDTRLNRDVALKILPAYFASDDARLGFALQPRHLWIGLLCIVMVWANQPSSAASWVTNSATVTADSTNKSITIRPRTARSSSASAGNDAVVLRPTKV